VFFADHCRQGCLSATLPEDMRAVYVGQQANVPMISSGSASAMGWPAWARPTKRSVQRRRLRWEVP